MAETNTINNIQAVVKGACFIDESLSSHTTFNIGGRAGLWIEPQDEDDLRNVLKEVIAGGLTWGIIGNGSNILAGEYGLPEVVIKLVNFNNISVDGHKIIAGSGVSLAKLVGFSVEHGLSGLEFLTGIPGLVGGAVKGNAGAQGRSMGEVIKELYVMDVKGIVHKIPRDKISFKYRNTDIKNDFVILRAVFDLVKSDKEAMHGLVKTYLNKRTESFPNEPNAGCIFKNPPFTSAGELIDKLGLKGFTVGKAMVSHKHANIIVNMDGADSKDVARLIKYVQDKVYEKIGIMLETEIIYWGNV